MCAEEDDNVKSVYAAAVKRAAAICARSEQCEAAVRRRLDGWGVPGPVAVQVIEYLKENSYIDNTRYMRSFVNDKFRFGKWGRQKIRHALKENGLSGREAEEALGAIDEEEYAAALQKAVSEKAARRGGAVSYADRAAVYNFCVMRGYEPELVTRAIDEYCCRGGAADQETRE